METNQFDELVARYGKTDAEIKALKKTNDADKETIKEYLADTESGKWTSGGYTVQRIESTTETMNEEKLLSVIKNYWATTHGSQECAFIKTREYIDMEALESAIYANELPNELLLEMNACRESKTTVALRCTKAKEK